MADPLIIPPAMEALTDKDGKPTASWYRLLQKLVQDHNRVSVEAAAAVAAADVGYDNATSGLAADDAQAAIDEVEERVDTLEALPVTHTLIASGAITNAANVDIPLDGDNWDEVEISLINIIPETDAASLNMRYDQGSGFLADASDYQWGLTRQATLVSDAADTEITLADAVGNNTNERLILTVRIFRPTAASFIKAAHWNGGYRAQNAVGSDLAGWGELIANSDPLTDARILCSSGNIASGYYAAIGKKYS
jgi:hypothetical protein